MLYHPVQIGALTLSGNLFLAPVAGYTDRVFRSICAGYGANFGFTELVSAEALVRNPARYGLEAAPDAGTAAANISRPGAAVPDPAPKPDGTAKNNAKAGLSPLLRRGPAETRYAIQLFGGDPAVLGAACRLLVPFAPDAVDLNAGCPVPKVVKNGAGSALMKDPRRLAAAVRAMVKACGEALGGVPLTVKIRAGWDAANKNYAECARAAVEEGAAMVSLHPRTRSQGYGGTSEWPLIADLASRLSVPVTGSGDLFHEEDAGAMLSQTGCAAVMFARGALGNPFIFEEAKALLAEAPDSDQNGPSAPPYPARRLDTALRHLEGLALDLGEKAACLEMRKQFCAYSKGLSGGAELRRRFIQAETIAAYREIAEAYAANLQ